MSRPSIRMLARAGWPTRQVASDGRVGAHPKVAMVATAEGVSIFGLFWNTVRYGTGILK